MKTLALILCICMVVSLPAFGAVVVEKDPSTGEVTCSYDTKNTDGKVNIDKTKDIYVDDELYREADVVEVAEEKTKDIAVVKDELVVLRAK